MEAFASVRAAAERDLARDMVVADIVVVVPRRQAQIATDAVDIDVAAADRPDLHVASDLAQRDVARARAPDRDLAADVAEPHVARADRIDARIAADIVHGDVARGDLAHLEGPDAVAADVAPGPAEVRRAR